MSYDYILEESIRYILSSYITDYDGLLNYPQDLAQDADVPLEYTIDYLNNHTSSDFVDDSDFED